MVFIIKTHKSQAYLPVANYFLLLQYILATERNRITFPIPLLPFYVIYEYEV